jgi:hypothetical protein
MKELQDFIERRPADVPQSPADTRGVAATADLTRSAFGAEGRRQQAALGRMPLKQGCGTAALPYISRSRSCRRQRRAVCTVARRPSAQLACGQGENTLARRRFGASRRRPFAPVHSLSRPVTPEVAGSSPVAPVSISVRRTLRCVTP